MILAVSADDMVITLRICSNNNTHTSSSLLTLPFGSGAFLEKQNKPEE
jgi:hypothetical protein